MFYGDVKSSGRFPSQKFSSRNISSSQAHKRPPQMYWSDKKIKGEPPKTLKTGVNCHERVVYSALTLCDYPEDKIAK